MTTDEYKRAFAIASDESIDLSGVDITIFNGYGLKQFKPVVATIQQVASLMRHQALYFNGTWDSSELTFMKKKFKRHVLCCDPQSN